ncbi:MAG TPA: transporter, partial [Chlorobaculum sp.]|nr:transporter [Chlorobaculum sp.]
LLAAVAMLWATPLHAAHPLITDDTGTQGKGKFQLELNSEFSNEKENEDGVSIKESGGEAAATLSYGLSDTIDLVAGLPWQWYRLKEDGSVVADEDGIGDLSLELKWRFFENSDKGLSLAIKPGISIPTGDERKGLGNGKLSGGALLIATCDSDIGALHANVGYTRNEYQLDEDRESSRNDIWHFSLATELNLAQNIRAVTNIGVETNSDKKSDNSPAFLIGGLIYSVSDDFDIDLGIKKGLNEVETDTTVLAGIAARF